MGELVGVEGKDVRVECLQGVGRCSWRTPYERTYNLLPGEYAERGRIQAGTGGTIAHTAGGSDQWNWGRQG